EAKEQSFPLPYLFRVRVVHVSKIGGPSGLTKQAKGNAGRNPETDSRFSSSSSAEPSGSGVKFLAPLGLTRFRLFFGRKQKSPGETLGSLPSIVVRSVRLERACSFTNRMKTAWAVQTCWAGSQLHKELGRQKEDFEAKFNHGRLVNRRTRISRLRTSAS